MGLCLWAGRGAPQSLLSAWGAGGAGRGEGRGTRHFSRNREPGRRPQSRVAGAAAAEAVAAATAATSGRFASEPAPGLQMRRLDVARPGLWKRAAPAEAERGLWPRPVRARQGGAHTLDSVRWRRWSLEVAAAAA